MFAAVCQSRFGSIAASEVVENLNLHAVTSWMSPLRDSDSNSVVTAFFQFEFEGKREVRVFFGGDEVMRAFAADQHAVFDCIF